MAKVTRTKKIHSSQTTRQTKKSFHKITACKNILVANTRLYKTLSWSVHCTIGRMAVKIRWWRPRVGQTIHFLRILEVIQITPPQVFFLKRGSSRGPKWLVLIRKRWICVVMTNFTYAIDSANNYFINLVINRNVSKIAKLLHLQSQITKKSKKIVIGPNCPTL